jgi:hypothetical protein
MSRLLLLSLLVMGCGDTFAVSLGSNAQPEIEMDEIVDAATSMDMPDAMPDEEEDEDEESEDEDEEEEEESGSEP